MVRVYISLSVWLYIERYIEISGRIHLLMATYPGNRRIIIN